MAKTKHIRLFTTETGLTVYAYIFRRPSDPDDDLQIFDVTDGKFRTSPADPYLDLTEDTTAKGLYAVEEDTTVWTDGFYEFMFYSQLGGAPAPATDDKIYVTTNRVKITEDTLYATFQKTDLQSVVEEAANDIIAALGTVVNSSFEGTATDGTNTTIEDTTAAWDTDIWASTVDIETLAIVESAATGVRYVVKIVSNTSNTLTVDALSGGYVVVAGDTYTIIRNSSAVDIKSVGGTAQTGGDWTTLLTNNNTKLDTIIGHVDEIEGKQDTGNTSLSNIETDTGNISTDTGNIATDTSTIAGDTTSIDGKLTDTNTKLDTLESSLTSMEGKQDTIIVNQGTTETAIDLTNTKLDTVETSLTSIEGKQDTGNTSLNSIDGKMTTLEDDVEVITATTPTIYNIQMVAADTEYSQAFTNAKKIIMSFQDGTPGEDWRFAFETGKVATPTHNYMQYDQSHQEPVDLLNFTGTIYLAASTTGYIQLLVWS